MLPCMALYCIGVMCSNPGGGTSQYLQVRFFLVLLGEWLRERRKDEQRPPEWAGRLLRAHLCFLCSLEELRPSRLLRSRLRLPRSLLQLRCLSPRLGGEMLRLLFLCRSRSRSVSGGAKTQKDENQMRSWLLQTGIPTLDY